MFHTTLLSPHVADTIPGRPLQPAPPVMVEGTEEYEVEGVLDSRFRRGGLEYLVRWKGYSAAEDTWEPERNLEHAAAKLAAFHRRYPQAPRRLAAAVMAMLPFVVRPEPLVDHALSAHPRGGVISGLSASWRSPERPPSPDRRWPHSRLRF